MPTVPRRPRFSGKRRSGGTNSSVLLQRLAILPLPLALPLEPLAFFLHPLLIPLHSLVQDLPDSVDVVGEEGEAIRQLEPIRAAQPYPIQPSVLCYYLCISTMTLRSRRRPWL